METVPTVQVQQVSEFASLTYFRIIPTTKVFYTLIRTESSSSLNVYTSLIQTLKCSQTCLCHITQKKSLFCPLGHSSRSSWHPAFEANMGITGSAPSASEPSEVTDRTETVLDLCQNSFLKQEQKRSKDIGS
jgi:hypothetical protein